MISATSIAIGLVGALVGFLLHVAICLDMQPGQASDATVLVKDQLDPVLLGQLPELLTVRQPVASLQPILGLPCVVTGATRALFPLQLLLLYPILRG